MPRSTKLVTADDVIARIGFGAEEIPHPIDLLTVDMAARAADVPATTIDSAVANASTFRSLVFRGVLTSLGTVPGGQTWQALRSIVDPTTTSSSLDDLFAARGRELAHDPAFPLFLSAFEFLDDPALAAAVNAALRGLVSGLWPFVVTAGAALGTPPPDEPTEPMAFATLQIVCTDAYRRLLRIGTHDADIDRRFTTLSASLLDESVAVDQSSAPGQLFPVGQRLPPAPSGQLRLAVDAGVELVLAGSLPMSTTITVAEARRRTEITTAAFYRLFGSASEFDRLLLERAGRSLADGFRDEFFDGLLEQVRGGTLSPLEGYAAFNDQVKAQTRIHVAEGRPGRRITPWLGSPAAQPLVTAAYHDAFEERGEFYRAFAELLGMRLHPSFRPGEVAGFLNANSVISDLLIRNAPEREAAVAVFERGMERITLQLLEPGGAD